MDAPGFADADLRRERDQRRVLVAGHAVAQESGVLEGLAPAAHLGLGESPGSVALITGLPIAEGIDPRHHGRDHALHGRDVVRAFAARQVVLAGLGRLRHALVDLRGADQPASGDVHVDHLEGRGQRLCRRLDAGQLVGEAGVVAEVGIAAGVHEDPAADAEEAGLGGHDELLTRPSRTVAALQEGVEEDAHAGLRGAAAPRRV